MQLLPGLRSRVPCTSGPDTGEGLSWAQEILNSRPSAGMSSLDEAREGGDGPSPPWDDPAVRKGRPEAFFNGSFGATSASA